MLTIINNPYVLLGLFIVATVVGGVWAYNKSKKKGGEKSMRVQSSVVVVVLLVLLMSLPTLSIDIEGIFTYAFDIVNAFMPLIAIVAGLGLGFGLVNKIGSLFQRAL
jgi:cytochrome bd-type quinol oxidase subunit 2